MNSVLRMSPGCTANTFRDLVMMAPLPSGNPRSLLQKHFRPATRNIHGIDRLLGCYAAPHGSRGVLPVDFSAVPSSCLGAARLGKFRSGNRKCSASAAEDSPNLKA